MLGATPCEYVDEPYIAKTRYTVLSVSELEDGIILHSFVLTRYRRVMDGRTERL